MSFSPYQIGISITLQNMVSSVLGIIAADMLKVEKIQRDVERGFHSWKSAAAIAGAGIVGVGALGAAAKLVEHGNELVKIQRDMAQAGATNVQIQNAYAEAWKQTAHNQNMSAVEILKMQNDARQIFGDQDLATHHIEPFVKMASFLKAYEGHEKGSSHAHQIMSEVNAAIKSGEIAGKIAPEEMIEHVKQMAAMKVVYGEGLKISNYLTAQRNAGVAMRNADDNFRYGMFPALVQENGQNAGTMLMTAFNKIVAGVANRTISVEEMNKIGLLNSDQLLYTASGHIKGLKDPDAIKNSREAAMNFGSWVMTTLKPLIDDVAHGDHIKESQLISKMFPDRNAAKAITEIIQQYSKLSKDAENMARARKAMNMDEYNAGSWDYQVEAFHAQWKNLLDALGAPLVKQATEMLAKVNKVMVGMAQWANANPEKAEMIGKVLIAVGVGLTALAGTAIASMLLAMLGPGGWLIAGFAALGSLTAMGGFNRQTFSKIVQWLHDGLARIYGMAQSGELKTKLVEGMKSFGTWLTGSFADNLYLVAVAGSQLTAKFVAVAWEVIKAIAGALWQVGKLAVPEFLNGAWEVIRAIAKAVTDAAPKILEMVSGAISGVFSSIGDMIRNSVGGWFSGWHLPSFGSAAPNASPSGPQTGFRMPPNPNGGGEKKSASILMQVDGKTLGQVVAGYIGGSGTYPLSPSFNDSHGNFSLPAFG